ncbi:MAG TPA: 50S ribosomal protein L30 [Clostridiales bacterium]|nr:50S ribosomal protein L30 [Clostridiales bacterium]
MAKAKQEKQLKITLVRSPIGTNPNQRKVIEALGLKKLNQSIERIDTPSVRGAIAKVGFLLKVEEL